MVGSRTYVKLVFEWLKVLATVDEYFVFWVQFEVICKADTFIFIVWGAGQFRLVVKEKYLF